MPTFLKPIALIISLSAAHSHAALVDLSTFSFNAGASANDSATKDLITMIGSVGARSNVRNIASFEYLFSYDNAPAFSQADVYNNSDDSLTVIASAPAGPTGSTGSTGWQLYEFSQPATGNIQISVRNQFGSDATKLLIRNMMDTTPVLPAVPEPETYAMLLAGLGLMGALARRKSRLASGRPSSGNPGRSITSINSR